MQYNASGSVVTSSNYWFVGMGMYRASTTVANSNSNHNQSRWTISSDDNTNDAQYPTTGDILSNPLAQLTIQLLQQLILVTIQVHNHLQ